MSPELIAVCHVELFLADRHNPLLRQRTKKWLRHNPDKLEMFVASDYTRHPGHYRRLTYAENRELSRWWWTPEQLKAEDDAHERAGGLMADHLYQAMNREGFMRTFLRKQAEQSVSEFNRAKEVRAARVVRRNHMPRSKLKTIIIALRNR